MSAGEQWQNGRISPKPSSVAITECMPPSDAPWDRDPMKEPTAKANIVKTYEYKISMNYDELVGRPLIPTTTTCQDTSAGGVTRLAGMMCSSGTPQQWTAVAAESAPVPRVTEAGANGQCVGSTAAAAAPASQQAAVAKQPLSSAPTFARNAAASSPLGLRHPMAASTPLLLPPGSGARDDVAEAMSPTPCPSRLGPSSVVGRCSPWPAEPTTVADGCSPVVAATAPPAARLGYNAAPVKDYVHFFESKHDDPGLLRKFVPPVAGGHRTAAVPAVASRASATAAAANGITLAAHHATDNSIPVTSPRIAGLRSNPAPLDTQQSLIRLSCAASGYGKYLPSSSGMRQALQASAESQPAPRAAEEQQHNLDSGSHEADVHDVDASAKSKLNGHGREPAAANGHCLADVGKEETANSVNSQVVDELRAGKQFLLQVLCEEDKLNRLCQLSRDDVDSGVLTEEVCGLLRSAIGKATLLVTKKFKQFKELCDKNMNQGDDERYKTTAGDLQGFWDMMMLQVEDVDRAFTEIARLRANGWKCDANTFPNDGDTDAHTVSDGHVKVTSDSSAAPGSGTAKPKGTPNRRHPTATPDNRNRKGGASGGTCASATPASKARDEARQRLLAAKKAMRRNSMTNDDAGATSADVVFLGGSSTS